MNRVIAMTVTLRRPKYICTWGLPILFENVLTTSCIRRLFPFNRLLMPDLTFVEEHFISSPGYIDYLSPTVRDL